MHKIALLSLMALAPIALQAHNDHAPSAQQSGGHDAGAPRAAPFTVVPGWAVGDNTAPTPAVGSTHGGIVVDKAGLIYVSSNRGIFVFNDAGDLVNSFQDPAYREIHAMTLREEDGVVAVLEVNDEGAGIDDASLARVFERGYTTKGGGHGYGLVSAREAVAGMGGWVRVQSQKGVGTRVSVFLPVLRASLDA